MPKYDTYRRKYFSDQVIPEMKEKIVFSKTYPERFELVFKKIPPMYSDVIKLTQKLLLISNQIKNLKIRHSKIFVTKSLPLEKYLSKYFELEHVFIHYKNTNEELELEYDKLMRYWDNEAKNTPKRKSNIINTVNVVNAVNVKPKYKKDCIIV